jgi:hypothetical protein
MNSKLLGTIGSFMTVITMSFLMAISLNSCTKKVTFLSSSVVPAAQGSVKFKKDKNKNHTIDIDVLNLAEPERLTPPKQTYVIWLVTEQNETKNIGQIKSSSGTFSKRLGGSFQTVATTKPIKIFITAENDPNVQTPGRVIVLTTDRIRQ